MGLRFFSVLLIVLSVMRLPAQTITGLIAVRVATGLTNPVLVTAPRGDYGRLFMVQLNGQIKVLELATGVVNPTPFISITVGTSGEQGLLGLAFDPDYLDAAKPGYGKFYVNYVANSGSGVTHVAQYQVVGDPATSNVADTTPSTIKTLLTVPQPQTNHNGGWIGFSPRANDDHNLYIALGDGGGGDDTGTGHTPGIGNAQDVTTRLGKMLRIQVDPATGTYTIPADNPYANSSITNVKKEIWLLGLRNPYRDSFDRGTGRMFIGDVGQNTREEVDAQEPTNPGGGENYGWRDREGTIENPTYATATPTPTPVPPRVNPIVDYPRSNPGNGVAGRTVIGGYVYRGKQIPALNGTYIFGDYLGPNGGASKIFALNYDGSAVTNFQDITSTIFTGSGYNLANPTGFGEDANGEIYIAISARAAFTASRR